MVVVVPLALVMVVVVPVVMGAPVVGGMPARALRLMLRLVSLRVRYQWGLLLVVYRSLSVDVLVTHSIDFVANFIRHLKSRVQ
jgi:hypothetical protein